MIHVYKRGDPYVSTEEVVAKFHRLLPPDQACYVRRLTVSECIEIGIEGKTDNWCGLFSAEGIRWDYGPGQRAVFESAEAAEKSPHLVH